MTTPRRIFITGGAGFIGRALAKAWLARGAHVAAYDDLSFGRRENLAEFGDRVRLVVGDVLDHERLAGAMAEFQPDVVYHLAALHYIPYCDANPLATLRVNVEGTASALEAAAAAEAKLAVVASTGAIYRSTESPLSEDSEPVQPSDIYGHSKALAEEVGRYYASAKGMPVVVARLFNTYGPFETNPHLVPHVIECLKRDTTTVTLGNVATKRDYIHVEDTAEALAQLGSVPPPPFSVFNVGTGEEHSAEDIIRELGALLGHPIEIRQDASRLRAVDKMHQIADVKKIEKYCGWTPRHRLREGLRQLLRHEGFAVRAGDSG